MTNQGDHSPQRLQAYLSRCSSVFRVAVGANSNAFKSQSGGRESTNTNLKKSNEVFCLLRRKVPTPQNKIKQLQENQRSKHNIAITASTLMDLLILDQFVANRQYMGNNQALWKKSKSTSNQAQQSACFNLRNTLHIYLYYKHI